MSNIKKSQRKPTNVEFFTQGLELVKEVMLYVTENFGLIELQHNVILFAQNHQMSDYDKADLMRIARQYNISVENSHAYGLIDTFRNEFYETCFKMLWSMSEANTVYPNSQYEANLRKQYIWDAISACEYLHILLQLILELNPTSSEKNINKLKSFVEKAKVQIRRLKAWKKDCTRLNKIAINNEAEHYAAQQLANNIALKKAMELQIRQQVNEIRNTAYNGYLQDQYKELNRSLCEVAFEHNPQFFIKQYHDENGNRINPAIIFFPRDIPTKQLPDYTFDYIDKLTITSNDKIDELIS